MDKASSQTKTEKEGQIKDKEANQTAPATGVQGKILDEATLTPRDAAMEFANFMMSMFNSFYQQSLPKTIDRTHNDVPLGSEVETISVESGYKRKADTNFLPENLKMVHLTQSIEPEEGEGKKKRGEDEDSSLQSSDK